MQTEVLTHGSALTRLYSFILPSSFPPILSLLSLLSILIPHPLPNHMNVFNIILLVSAPAKLYFCFRVQILNFYKWYFVVYLIPSL